MEAPDEHAKPVEDDETQYMWDQLRRGLGSRLQQQRNSSSDNNAVCASVVRLLCCVEGTAECRFWYCCSLRI